MSLEGVMEELPTPSQRRRKKKQNKKKTKKKTAHLSVCAV
jgi:hypothetical protein